jgi:hypothetical protein
MSRPTPELLTELEFVFYYLSKNPDIGLTFEKGDCFPLEGRADASWEAYRSTSGWRIKWQNASISWGSVCAKQHRSLVMRGGDHSSL